MKNITKISQNELLEARGTMPANFSASVYDAKNSSGEKPKKSYYINKINDSEIAKFFKPLGYISHMRVDGNINDSFKDPYITVFCQEYIIMFSDFTTKVYEQENFAPYEYFDDYSEINSAVKLKNFAELTNTTVGKLVADSVAVNFLGQKFPGTYASKKRIFDQNNLRHAFKKLSPEHQKFFGSAKEIAEADITSTYNMNAYGKANIEEDLKYDN